MWSEYLLFVKTRFEYLNIITGAKTILEMRTGKWQKVRSQIDRFWLRRYNGKPYLLLMMLMLMLTLIHEVWNNILKNNSTTVLRSSFFGISFFFLLLSSFVIFQNKSTEMVPRLGTVWGGGFFRFKAGMNSSNKHAHTHTHSLSHTRTHLLHTHSLSHIHTCFTRTLSHLTCEKFTCSTTYREAFPTVGPYDKLACFVASICLFIYRITYSFTKSFRSPLWDPNHRNIVKKFVFNK